MTKDDYQLFAKNMLKNYSDWARDNLTQAYDNARAVQENDEVLAVLIAQQADVCVAIRDHLRVRLLEVFKKPELKS